jgi:hypothetical protein
MQLPSWVTFGWLVALWTGISEHKLEEAEKDLIKLTGLPEGEIKSYPVFISLED